MLIITKQGVGNLINRLSTPNNLEQCRDEIQKMLEIESEHLWWAESGKCCRWQVTGCLAGRIQTLKDALNSLNGEDISRAASLLREYANQLDEDGAGIVL